MKKHLSVLKLKILFTTKKINDDSLMNVAVVSGRACHVLQAVFSPFQ